MRDLTQPNHHERGANVTAKTSPRPAPTGWRRVVRDLVTPYRPHALPWWVGTALSIIVSFSALVRGVDLAFTPPPPRGVSTNSYVDILGIEWWGHAMIVTAVVIAIGVVSRRVGPLLLGHAAGVGVYLGYAIALAQGVINDPTPGGWRFVSSALAALAVHLLRCVLLMSEVKTLGRRRT